MKSGIPQKKILFLGAAHHQVRGIQYAYQQGYHVITCDNVPSNPGHRFAHRSFDASTTDISAVLDIARKQQIDGIITSGSDVSAEAVARVVEDLELPGNSLDSVKILTNKSRFRRFLEETHLQTIRSQSFTRKNQSAIDGFVRSKSMPMVVKPIDSSGSKGITRIDSPEQTEQATELAFSQSRSGEIVIESFVPRHGPQVCGDGFAQDGEILMMVFGDGHLYEDYNQMVPFGESFPSRHRAEDLERARHLLQTIITKTGFRQGPFNVDLIFSSDGTPYIFELGPRSGGNFLPEIIEYHTGIDVTGASVEVALNREYRLRVDRRESGKCHAGYMVHSLKSGILKTIRFSEAISSNIVRWLPFAKPGDSVFPFHSGNKALGACRT